MASRVQKKQDKVAHHPLRGRRTKKFRAQRVFSAGVKFHNTGCASLDVILGGGYAEGRMINIIGDKSSGKWRPCLPGQGANVCPRPDSIAIKNESDDV